MEKARRRQSVLLQHIDPIIPTASSCESFVSSSICSAEDDGAYERTVGFGDDVVIVAAYRTAICKSKRGGFKDTLPDDLLSTVLKTMEMANKDLDRYHNALDKPEELRVPFERYGPVKDVYLPRNYYTGEPRGFGFVKFRYPEDAAKAKERLNRKLIGGREIRIVFAEESRKTPSQMRMTSRTTSRYGGSSRRRSYSRSPRHRNHSYSRSPSPAGRYSRSRSQSYSPRDERKNRSSRRSYSPEDASPRDKKEHEARRGSESPRDLSPSGNGYRSSRRSPTSRETSPLNERGQTLSEKSPGPREVSPHAYPRSRKNSRGHKETSPRIDKKKTSPSRSPTSTDQSHKSHKSNRRSLTPEENGRSAKHGRNIALSTSKSLKE